MFNLLELIKQQKWKKISLEFTPEEIATLLSFHDGMKLCFQLLENEQLDDSLSKYGVRLTEEIRKKFPKEWADDWRNDIFLGDGYYLTMQPEKCYEAYKRGIKKEKPLPYPLMVSLAGCYLSPQCPITVEEAEKLLLKALKIEKTIEAVTLLRGIYKTQGNQSQFLYWDKILDQVEKENLWMNDNWPRFLKEIYEKN